VLDLLLLPVAVEPVEHRIVGGVVGAEVACVQGRRDLDERRGREQEEQGLVAPDPIPLDGAQIDVFQPPGQGQRREVGRSA
jgi:hypothetical protein